jgi:hypothetical protein
MYKVLDRDTIKTLQAKRAKLEKRYPRIWDAYGSYLERGWVSEEDESIPMRFIYFMEESEQAEDYIQQIANVVAHRDGFNSASDPDWEPTRGHFEDWFTVGEASNW